MSRRLIVNADDFGMTEGVSRGIAGAHRGGIVTSATAMVHLGSLGASLAHLRGVPGLGLGLHITLTWGAPAAGAERVPSLVEQDGRFPRDKAALAGRARPDELKLECAAQLARFVKAFGRPPTHVDSHHQAHTLSPIREAVLDLAAEHGLPVRSPDDQVRGLARARGLATPDAFLGGAGDEPYWTVDRLLDTIRALARGTTEIMCHPGHFDADLAHSRYGRQREVEYATFTHPPVREAVRAAGVELVSFAALHGPGGAGPK